MRNELSRERKKFNSSSQQCRVLFYQKKKKKKKKKKQNKDTEVNFIKMLEKLTNFEQAGLVVCSGRLLTGINSNNGQLNDAQRRQFFKLVDPFSNYETSFNSNLRIN